MRCAAVCLFSVLIAHTAGAVSLTIEADQSAYQIGDTVTLIITGDAEGASDDGIFGRLTYNAGVTDTVASSQQPLTTSFGNNTWTQGALQTGDGFADVFNQLYGGPADDVPSNTLQATVTLIAWGEGTWDVSWIAGGGPDSLDFFGLTDAPSGSFCVEASDPSCALIPEPTPGLLLGLGLVLLAWSVRRR